MTEPFHPSRAAALAAVDLAGGVALYSTAPALGLLLAGVGVLVLGGALHRTVRDAAPVTARVTRRS